MAGLPTVAYLCRTLPGALQPAPGSMPTETAVTGVHVSELAEPGPYLDGGELLLTIGLAVENSESHWREYVANLVAAKVAALVFGLGPVYQSVPEPLGRLCVEAGLCLLIVPIPVPFLVISRAYWSAVARQDRRDLTDALTTSQRLVAAILAVEPVPAVLTVLAKSVRGWAAFLDPSGRVTDVQPSRLRAQAGQVRAEIARLQVAGLRSAATFPVNDHDVVLYPIGTGRRAVGYLATASAAPMTPLDRNLVLTACALLGIQARRGRETHLAQLASRALVCRLLLMGETVAAKRLAGEVGLAVPADRASVVAVIGTDIEDIQLEIVQAADRLLQASEPSLAAADSEVISILLSGTVTPTAWTEFCEQLWLLDPQLRIGRTDEIDLELLGGSHRQLIRSVRAQEVGTQTGPGSLAGSWFQLGAEQAATSLAPIIDRPELIEALAAYLRHRGQWEAAARDLGLHRNTLRYRINRVRELFEVDIDEPDTAAQLWFALRATGLA